jgi:NAD(P)-dependent dehydrogenase (short-subunit alcohol dehydrogenase family)
MRLIDRVALVTGASRGIGRAIAIGLAREGAAVVVNFHTRTAEAAEVVDTIVAAGGRAFAWKADVSVAAEVDAMVAGTVERYGGLDILVNNAAMVEVHRPWTEITEELGTGPGQREGRFLCLGRLSTSPPSGHGGSSTSRRSVLGTNA